MNIILLKTCDLGNKDDLISVKDGFGQNFIINKGLGVLATPDLLENRAKRLSEKEKEEVEALKKSNDLKILIDETYLTFERDVVGEKMFGSIGNKDISDKLEELDIFVPKKNISMSKIYTLGTYTAKINCLNGVSATLNIDVEAK